MDQGSLTINGIIEPIEFEIERSDVSQCGCVYITLVFPAAFLTQADQCGEQIVEFQCLDLVLDGMLEPKIDELHSQHEFGRAVPDLILTLEGRVGMRKEIFVKPGKIDALAVPENGNAVAFGLSNRVGKQRKIINGKPFNTVAIPIGL